MKNQLVSLVLLCLISAPLWSLAENDAASKTDIAPGKLTFENDSAKTASSQAALPPAAANELSVRIQAVMTTRSTVVEAIVSMAEAGVEQEVMQEFARNASVPLLRPDEVLHLHGRGVSSQIITTLIKRSGEVKAEQTQAIRESQERLAQQRAARVASITAQTPASAPAAHAPVYNNYYVNQPPAYPYAYPAYTYAYPSYPIYSYGYSRPSRAIPHRTSEIYPYAQRYHDFRASHQPFSSFNATVQTPSSPQPFFASRWVWNGTTGKPVDLR